MRLPAVVVAPLRRLADLIRARWFGRILLRLSAGLVRVQIFDRSMTVAAQVFTSIFPVLIMLSPILGRRHSTQLAALARLPNASEQVLEEAFTGRSLSSFGIVGSLVVLASATSLARALARAYGAIWEQPRLPAGLAATWRWFATIMLLPAYMVGTRMLAGLAGRLPLPYLSSSAVNLVADVAVAVVLPWLVLGATVPVRLLLPGGCAFGVAMLAVRPAGSVYLPRALEASADRYGAIGLAFTYIGWLYVLSFCLLAAAVLGRALADDDGVFGRLIRTTATGRRGKPIERG